MINLGSKLIKSIYIGTKEVIKVYIGNTQIYPSGSLSLSVSSLSFIAAGESKSLTINVNENQNWNLTISPEFVASKTSGTGTTTINITASNNTSTLIKSGIITVTSGSLSTTCNLSQVAGSKIYSTPIVNLSYPDIQAKGGTVNPTVSYSQTWTWNGVVGSGGTITTGGVLKYSGTSVNTTSGVVSADSKGIKVSNRTKVTTASVTVTLNDKKGSKSVDVYQAANTSTLTSVEIRKNGTGEIVTDFTAAGGTAYYKPMGIYTYTSGSTQPIELDTQVSANNWSLDQSWGSVSANPTYPWCSIVKINNRGTEIGNERTVTLKLTLGNLSDSVVLTQEANQEVNYSIYGGVESKTPTGGVNDWMSAKGGTFTFFTQLKVTYSSGITGERSVTQDTEYVMDSGGYATVTNNKASIPSRGITIENARYCGFTQRYSIGGKTYTSWFNTAQNGNYVESIKGTIGTFSYPTISAGATSATPNLSAGFGVLFTFSSGSTSSSTPAATYGSLSVPSSFKLSASQNGFTAVNSSNGVLTATNRGTEIGNSRTSGVVTRTLTATWTPTSSYNTAGTKTNSWSTTATCAQNGNYVTSLSLSGVTFTYPGISAGVTSATPSVSGGLTIFNFSSGSSTHVQPSSTFGNYSNKSITYTLGSVQNGFTAVNSSTGVLTATNRGTEIGNARTSGVVTRKLVTQWVPTSSYNAAGTITGQLNSTATCTQAANTLTWNTPTISRTTPVSIPVGGGTNNVATGLTYSQTGQYSSGSPASASSGGSLSYSVVTAKTGFSLAGSTVTVTNNTSTSARNGFVVRITLKLNDKTATKDITYNQPAGYYTYANPVVSASYLTIPASGGTVTPTVSYSQTYGWNGATSGAGTKTSGGSVSYSGTSVNTSNGSVTAGSKGTTVSGVTTVTNATVTVDMNGKRGTKTVAVQQAANAVKDSNYNPRITAYGTPAVSIGSGMTAAGGSATVSHSVSNTQTYNALYTSGATGPNQTRSVAGTTTISITSNGNNAFSLSGNTLSHRDMATTLATDSVTITAKNSGDTSKTKTASTSITNSRQATGSSGGVTTYGNVVAGTITNKTIPASGGSATATAGNGSQSWSKTAVITTYEYTSGDTKQETTTAASSGNNTIAPSVSSITANASSKGLTVSGQTTVKTQAVTWSGSASKSASGTMYIYQAANSLKGYSNILINQFFYYDIPYSGGTSSPVIDIIYDVTYDSGTYSDEHGLPTGYSLTYGTTGSWFKLNTSTGVITAPNNTTTDIKSVIVTVNLSRNSDHVVITSTHTTVTQAAKPGPVDIYITTSFDYASSRIRINFSSAPQDTFFIKFMGYDQFGGIWEDVTGIVPSPNTSIDYTPVGYSITDQFSIEGLGASEYTISPSSPYETSNARYYWTSTFKVNKTI